MRLTQTTLLYHRMCTGKRHINHMPSYVGVHALVGIACTLVPLLTQTSLVCAAHQ